MIPVIRALRLQCVMLLLAFVGSTYANDPTPATDTLTVAKPEVSFMAGPMLVSNESYNAGGNTCSPPQVFRCDDFKLVVDLPADYASTHPRDVIRLTASWTDATEDFDFFIYDKDGNEISGGVAATGADPELADVVAGAGHYELTVRVFPYKVMGGTVNAKLTLVSPPPVPPLVVPPQATGVAPRFYVYTPALAVGSDSGEPSIGYNRHSKNVMYQSGGAPLGKTETLKLTFPENLATPLPEACDGTWTDVSYVGLAEGGLDPISFTDEASGRTFVSHMVSVLSDVVGVAGTVRQGLNSRFAYTDDDGANWMPGQIGAPGGYDHQTVGSGPWPAGLKPATASFDSAVYYCSQNGATGYCGRSDDGGLTFGLKTTLYDNAVNGCAGVHGHVRVAPDGTVYVPHASCQHMQAALVSEDAGKTFEARYVPTSSEASGITDPSVGIAKDGTAYFCYTNGDGHPHVAVSKDKGKTWDKDTDIGYYQGIQFGVFMEAIAGDPDRASCAFIGTTTAGNHEAADFAGIWYPFVATTYDGGHSWHTVNLSPNDPVQREGGICNSGGGCSGSNRNLLDFNEITLDEKGRPIFGYADGCVAGCVQAGPNSFSAHATVARLLGARPLLAEFDPPANASPAAACLAGKRDEKASHLSWRVPDYGSAAISGYKIYRGASATDQTLIAQTTTPKAAYDDLTADAGVSNYTYKITALNSAGEGLFSNLVTLPVTTLPLAETACVAPGLTVATDGAGDSTSMVPGTDLRSVSLSEPADLPGKLVVTIKVDTLSPTAPPNHRWVTLLSSDTVSNLFVAMLTDQGPARFVYGLAGSMDTPAASVGTYTEQGALEAGSGYQADGTIVLILDKAKLGSPAAGAQLTNVSTKVRTTSPGPGAGLTVDDPASGAGSYTLRADNACLPNTAPLAVLTASVRQGTRPLTVRFSGAGSSDAENDAIQSYVFSFGDGSSDVTQPAVTIDHVYTQPGIYNASLQVKDARGLDSSNVANQIITVDTAGTGGASAVGGSTGRFGGAIGVSLLPLLAAIGLRRRRRH